MGTVHYAPACSVASTTVPIQEPQPACFCKFLARLLAQRRFVDLAAKTKREFARFDFLRIAQLHFDGNVADHRQPVAVIDDPVHVLDQENDDSIRKEAMNAGCIAYLRKPFAPHLLLDALGKAVA